VNRLPIVAILVISTMPLYAHGQQPDVAKLKADAQTKTQAYCQINELAERIGEADDEKDTSPSHFLGNARASISIHPRQLAMI
jgi:hypothetical protein